MKAVLAKSYGPPENLVLEEIASPLPGPEQVQVAVHASGVNFPDTLIIENRYQFKPPLPFTPGSEVAGIVKATGAGVTGFAPGDRVIAACGQGGYAEEVVVATDRLLHLPSSIDMTAAAALQVAYGTSYYALKMRAHIRPGETLLVLGAAGGIEAVFSILAVHEQVAPPTANLVNIDPACDLDYVPLQAREMPIRAALSNSFGFGGTNGTLIFSRT